MTFGIIAIRSRGPQRKRASETLGDPLDMRLGDKAYVPAGNQARQTSSFAAIHARTAASRSMPLMSTSRIMPACWVLLRFWLTSSWYTAGCFSFSSTEPKLKVGSSGQSLAGQVSSGEFVAPWDWRRGERAPAAAPEPVSEDCQIKGNINSRGDRIYHVPGSPSWAGTIINESRGERMFCTVEAARQAGWRAPR